MINNRQLKSGQKGIEMVLYHFFGIFLIVLSHPFRNFLGPL